MAYISSNDNQNVQGMNQKKKNEQEDAQMQTNAPVLSGQSATSPTGGQTSPGQPQAPKANSSGGAAGFQQYQKANQGAATNRLAQSVQQNIGSSANQAQKVTGQATTAFGQKMDQGSLQNRQNALQDVSGVLSQARNVVAAPKVQPVDNKAQVGVVQPSTSGVSDRGNLTAQQPTQPSAPMSVDQAGTERFRDVINAEYKGPQSLRQAGLYDLAQGRVSDAQRKIDLAGKAGTRQDLLSEMYKKPGTDYSRGLSGLDAALLNTNSQGIQNIVNQNKNIGNLQKDLDRAQAASELSATGRASEIKNIQEQARALFDTEKTAEQKATDDRLAAVVKDWDKLPEYYRNIIRNKEQTSQGIIDKEMAKYNTERSAALGGLESETSQQAKNLQKLKEQRGGYLMENFDIREGGVFNPIGNQDTYATKQAQLKAFDDQIAQAEQAYKANQSKLSELSAPFQDRLNQINQLNKNQAIFSAEEAALLGLQSGQGLYNLGADAIKTAQAEKDRLVSRNEVARQLALQQLAQLDQQKRLDQNVAYGNLDRAGTQDTLDALDVAGTQAAIKEAEDLFQQSAEGANLTGSGQKKVSRGNALSKKTKTYYSGVGGNVADMLQQAGYDFDQAQALAAGEGNQVPGGAILQNKDLLNKYLGATSTTYDQDPSTFLQSAGTGAAAGYALGGPVGAGVGAAIGGSLDSGNVGEMLLTPGLGMATLASDGLMALDEMGVPIAGALGKGVQDVRNVGASLIKGVGNSLGGTQGQIINNIGSVVGGIDTGAMKKYGTQVARQKAIEDLKNKYSNYLQGQGFENRINVANNEDTLARTEGLRSLLANLDKTNRG